MSILIRFMGVFSSQSPLTGKRVCIIPIYISQNIYADTINKEISADVLPAKTRDHRKRIRKAIDQGYDYIIVIGRSEMQDNTIRVRYNHRNRYYQTTLKEFQKSPDSVESSQWQII